MSGGQRADPPTFGDCSDDGFSKYILGPVEVDGGTINDAISGLFPGPREVSPPNGGYSSSLMEGTKLSVT